MKILLVSDTYFPNVNGAAYFTYRLAHALSERGHAVSVMAPAPHMSGTVYSEGLVRVYGIPSIPIPLHSEYRLSPTFGMKHRIVQYLDEIVPDVIHLQNHFVLGRTIAPIGKTFGIPMVGTNHFMPENLVHYLHLPSRLERMATSLAWRQFMRTYGELDVVTAPTKIAAEHLRKIGFQKPVQSISCGIDPKRFHPGYAIHDLELKYKIPNVPRILYLGRLDKDKQVEDILVAFKRVLQHLRAHLILAGDGKERDSLEARAEQLGIRPHLTFTGFIPEDDLPRIYGLGDVFVMPGLVELQSIATMEAMASGLPVVAANAMALPELVQEGETGYLFAPGNESELADRLCKILANPVRCKKMGERGLQFIQQHRLERTVEAFERVYRQAILLHA